MKKYVLIVDMIFEKMKPYLLVTELLLGLKVTLLSFEELGKENMERWKTQTREERLQDAWENRNKFEIRPDQGGLPRVNIPMNTMLFLTVIFVVAVFLAKYLA